MFSCNVERFITRRTTAPFGPATAQPVSRRAPSAEDVLPGLGLPLASKVYAPPMVSMNLIASSFE